MLIIFVEKILTWEEHLLEYCRKYNEKLEWVGEVEKIVVGRKDGNRTKYIREFN
jgi:hypothetical protein